VPGLSLGGLQGASYGAAKAGENFGASSQAPAAPNGPPKAMGMGLNLGGIKK